MRHLASVFPLKNLLMKALKQLITCCRLIWERQMSNNHNLSYGSGIVVTGAGFFLNNEMGDFSSKPGQPNAFDLIGNEANSI